MTGSTREPPGVVVVGGGHAGVEAAVAVARLGIPCALVTLDPAALGRMSCNPSIGGLGKGQMVREIDALGGVMGRIADRTAIHFRLLNRRKGPAVQSPRCQNDRDLYAAAVAETVRASGATVVAGEVSDLVVEDARVAGVLLADGRRLRAAAVILTTGTFLGGILHVGEESRSGGRLGEGAAHALSRRLAAMDFRMGRLKTGTPPRFERDSIDWDLTESQPSDDPPVTFSFSPQPLQERRVSCALTRTTPEAHEVIAANLDRSPLFAGRISGRGPRYCPSIEDKVFRFVDRDSHQIFLEPEGLDSDLIYPNGISTSLPRDAQESFVRCIPALRDVVFAAHGYAVEYDHVDPTECGPTLEAIRLPGLFLAGQINGTTGYEEAAAQGLVAGINAARAVKGESPFVLHRHEAYVGVLIDDLTTRGVEEPYRMFTSLAEHRLLLRHQDADLRLAERADAVGLVSAEDLAGRRERTRRRDAARALLQNGRTPEGSQWDSLRRPGIDVTSLAGATPELAALGLDERDRAELQTEAEYAAYVDREHAWIARRREAEECRIPGDLDFGSVVHLRAEAREKFARIRPATLGQAGRISGIGPADVSVLLVHLEGRRRRAEALR